MWLLTELKKRKKEDKPAVICRERCLTGAIGANRTENAWGFANESADFDLRKQE